MGGEGDAVGEAVEAEEGETTGGKARGDDASAAPLPPPGEAAGTGDAMGEAIPGGETIDTE